MGIVLEKTGLVFTKGSMCPTVWQNRLNKKIKRQKKQDIAFQITERRKMKVPVHLQLITFVGPSSQLDAGLVEGSVQTCLALWLREEVHIQKKILVAVLTTHQVDQVFERWESVLKQPRGHKQSKVSSSHELTQFTSTFYDTINHNQKLWSIFWM